VTFVAYSPPEYDAMRQALRQANISSSSGATAAAPAVAIDGTLEFLLNSSCLSLSKNILVLQDLNFFIQMTTMMTTTRM
jgi:hypothetical protein